MLKITLHDSATECRFRLEGRLCGPWVAELEMCWRTAASTTADRKTTMDLGEVDFVDDAGRALLQRMDAAGVRFLATTPVIKEIVQQIGGELVSPEAGALSKRTPGLHKLVSRTCLALMVVLTSGFALGAEPEAVQAVLNRYLSAPAASCSETATRVEIQASLPKSGRSGVVEALEYVPSRGRALFHIRRFQGDPMVKRQVIARYMTAEAEARAKNDGSLSLSPENYHFRFLRSADYVGRQAMVWHVEPRHRKIGLYSGELWLDAESGRPLRQWGRFVKSPSVFIKQVNFVRDYDVETGDPLRLILNLDAVLAGTEHLTVWYHPVAAGPGALAAFQCDTGRKPLTTVAESSDVALHTPAGPDACAL